MGGRAIPDQAAGEREQVLHQARLAGQLDFDGAVTKTAHAARLEVVVVLVHGLHRLFEVDEFDVGIHSLGRDPLHDDVHRLIAVIQNLGVASHESNHLRALRRKWNLYCVSQAARTRNQVYSTHILEFDNTTIDGLSHAWCLHKRKVLRRQGNREQRKAARRVDQPVELSGAGNAVSHGSHGQGRLLGLLRCREQADELLVMLLLSACGLRRGRIRQSCISLRNRLGMGMVLSRNWASCVGRTSLCSCNLRSRLHVRAHNAVWVKLGRRIIVNRRAWSVVGRLSVVSRARGAERVLAASRVADLGGGRADESEDAAREALRNT